MFKKINTMEKHNQYLRSNMVTVLSSTTYRSVVISRIYQNSPTYNCLWVFRQSICVSLEYTTLHMIIFLQLWS